MNKRKKFLKLTFVSFVAITPLVNVSTKAFADTTSNSSTTQSGVTKSLEIKENMTFSQIFTAIENAGINDGSLTPEGLYKQLKEQNISVIGNRIYIVGNRILGTPNGFSISIPTSGKNDKINVRFGTGESTNTAGNDILKTTYTEDNKDKSEAISGKIFLIDENTEFNPLSFKASNGNTYKVESSDKAEVKVVSNTVDPTKANSWGVVTVSTTTKSGKETQASYAVYVRNDKPVRLNVPYYTSVYGLQSVETNNFLNDPATIRRGTEIYIGKNFMNAGSDTYNSISTKSLAIADNKEKASWMSTADLLTDAAPIEAVEKTVMHRSLVYSQGGSSKYRHIAAFKKVTVEKEPYTFKGVKYYKIIDAPDYIKVANVDGTKRTLKHNAYIYATSTKRADRTVLKKGTTVITYGSSYKFKNGKSYYRIQGATATNKRYVKVANFE